MKKIKNIEKLIVRFNGHEVGYLVSKEGNILFEYNENWLIDGFSISPFSLPLKRNVFVNKKSTFDGLFGVFANSLPDGWGELMMTKRLAKEGIDYERLSPLTKLTLLGNRVKGGLTYEPDQTMTSEEKLDLDEIASLAKEILAGRKIEEDKLDDLTNVMGSSGGARPKAYIDFEGKEWIVKFPGQFDSKECGKDEFEANVLAKRCGLVVNEFRLFDSKKCSGYFGAQRFDRASEKHIHMISLSSLLETSFRLYNLDYLHLFKVTRSISKYSEDLYEVFGRMCFNVIYGNKDDHGNNFSFLYDEEQNSYRLSPFYDITKTIDMVEHSMTVLGQGNPSEEDLLSIAKEAGLSNSRCTSILANIRSVIMNKGS